MPTQRLTGLTAQAPVHLGISRGAAVPLGSAPREAARAPDRRVDEPRPTSWPSDGFGPPSDERRGAGRIEPALAARRPHQPARCGRVLTRGRGTGRFSRLATSAAMLPCRGALNRGSARSSSSLHRAPRSKLPSLRYGTVRSRTLSGYRLYNPPAHAVNTPRFLAAEARERQVWRGARAHRSVPPPSNASYDQTGGTDTSWMSAQIRLVHGSTVTDRSLGR
jgi:hypothetical protein